MDLSVGEMGFIFCGKHPLLVSRTQVSDPGPNDPLVSKIEYLICFLLLTIDVTIEVICYSFIKYVVTEHQP